MSAVAVPSSRIALGPVLAALGLTAFASTLAAGLAAHLAWGLASGYFLLDSVDRLEHPLHDTLRSGGSLGVFAGVFGTALMTAMLSYTVRKWIGTHRWFRWLGSPVWWLRFHIVCGIAGPLFIVLHTGLHWPTGLVAVAFWCMVLVALSGVFGRYVYGWFPRSAAGGALNLKEAKAELADLRARLVAATTEADGARIGEAVALVKDFEHPVRGLVDWFRLDFEVRRRSDLVEAHLRRAGLAGRELREARRALVSQLRLQRSLGSLEVSRRLFRWWHLFHNPLARAMYLITAVHVFNAVVFGGALTQLEALVP